MYIGVSCDTTQSLFYSVRHSICATLNTRKEKQHIRPCRFNVGAGLGADSCCVLLQTSHGSKRSADVLDVLLQEDLQDDRDTSDDAKRAKCMDTRMLSHEEKLERRCAVIKHSLMTVICPTLLLGHKSHR